MRILLLTHAFNSLTQRLYVDLVEDGHDVTVEFDINDAVTKEAVALAEPDVIVAPFLKRRIPASIFLFTPCLIVHPGPPGDRGASALDWAILEGADSWGVTILQAEDEMDAGDIWACEAFPLRDAPKSSLYRREVTEAASRALRRALSRLDSRDPAPAPPGEVRPVCRQTDRSIDWMADSTATVLRKVRSADGHPGLKDTLFGEPAWLFDASPADGMAGVPGTEIARCGWAVAKATSDGAVWIGHARRKTPPGEVPSIKLPTALAFPMEAAGLPEEPGPNPIRYQEMGAVGVLHFPFYNGAMAAEQCIALRDAFLAAAQRPTKVIVLMGGPDFWSNGIHLNTIEAAASPAEESWRCINAMDDLAEVIITTTSHLTVAALQGNAGAGGVFLALAADYVWARAGVVLNPHYKNMGNLFGSEYWTYLLPRRAGEEGVAAVMAARLPIGTAQAEAWGLVDRTLAAEPGDFVADALAGAEALAAAPDLDARLEDKAARRAADEAEKPLSQYRAEELEKMTLNFFGFDPSYHVARSNFVLKVPKSHTPLHLAKHRRKDPAG